MLDRVPLMMASRKGERVRFAAVIEPVRKGAGATVRSVAVGDDAGAVRITVETAAGNEQVVLTAAGRLSVERAGTVLLKSE